MSMYLWVTVNSYLSVFVRLKRITFDDSVLMDSLLIIVFMQVYAHLTRKQ